MPEPDTVKKPWERFADKKPPSATDGPWMKFKDKPTSPQQTASAVPPEEGLAKKTARGAALGAFSGLGIAETQTPVKDTAKSYAEQAKTVAKFWTLKQEDMKASLLANPVAAVPRAMTEGFLDVIKDINPLIDNMFKHLSTVSGGRQFSDKQMSSVDPEKTAHDLSQIATQILLLKGGADEHSTIVDGPIKAADKIAKGMKTDSSHAVTTAHKLSEGVPSRILRRRAFEDAYVHAKGLDIAKKVDKAARAVGEEVKTHAEGIAKEIDTKIPTGVVDAGSEAALIKKEFQDVVKAPEKAHPVLVQMVKDAQATAPNLWSWEKARQFRSSVGRALGKVEGPQHVVLTRVYRDLTSKLGGAAKQYGLTKSWEHYNELASKMDKEFGDIADDIGSAKSGQEVAQRLNRDPGLTSEFTRNLSKYGLKTADILDYMSTAKRILRSKDFWNRSLFRLVYGSPAGLSTTISLRMAGAPYVAAMGGGFLVGMATSYLVNLGRVLKLSPDIIEHMMKERELPGKVNFEPGTFPSEEVEGGAPPKEPAQLPPPSGPSGLHEPISGESEMERIRRLGTGSKETPKPSAEETKASDEARSKLVKKVEPKKVSEGEHGTGKLAEQAKARERVSKARGTAKRTKEAKEAEAQARAQAQHLDVSALQIPELEEYVRTKRPTEFSGLQKLRKAKSIPDEEYIEALKYLVLEGLEQ